MNTAPPHDPRALRLVEAICDHFATAQTPYGRPAPGISPFASGGSVIPRHLHSPPFAALSLYAAARSLDRPDYAAAADRYVLFLLGAIRDPMGGRWDIYTQQLAREYRDPPHDETTHPDMRFLLSRSWMCGIALDALCRGFLSAHPDETAFLAKANALYEWLGCHRTDHAPRYRIGYPPTGVEDPNADGSFSDDLGFVGRGLASYYALSRRSDVLDDLTSLAAYFLAPHQENSDEGCFSESAGSWVICPWPMVMRGEHIDGTIRGDRVCWTFSTREAVDFLTRLRTWTPDDVLQTVIADRVVRAMKWAFDACQFPDGACGIMGRDDAFTGATGAAISNYLDCRDAGLLSPADHAEYGNRARLAMQWLLDWSPDALLRDAGHRTVNGGVTLNPPENLAWLLAWTVDALLRHAEVA